MYECSQEQSVHFLIGALCKSIASENGIFNDKIDDIVPKLRSKCFEILLQKSPHACEWPDKVETKPFDALYALDAHLFAIKASAKARGQDASDFEAKMYDHIHSCSAVFKTDEGNRLLQFLLLLQQSLQEDESFVPITNSRPQLLMPGPFTLNANFSNNRYYPKNYPLLPRNASPKYFQSVEKLRMKIEKNALMKPLSESVRRMLPKSNNKYNFSPSNFKLSDDIDEYSFTGLTRRHVCSDVNWLRIDMRSLQLSLGNRYNFYALQSLPFILDEPLRPKQKSKPERVRLKPKVEKETKMESRLIEEQYVKSWSWDQLGSRSNIRSIKPFVSDVNLSFELQALEKKNRNQQFQAKILTSEQLLRDFKFLIVGLQSDTFQHDEFIIFHMLPDVAVPNLLPQTIANYASEFLECGTCFKRLQIMAKKRNFRLLYDGFIFKALCDAINEYLLTFREFVFLHTDSGTLSSFYQRMKNPMRQIVSLAVTLAIHPKVDPNAKLPRGSLFLGYIYREIMRLTDDEYITLLMFILKRCCYVYFKYLQLWIFHGVLDDPSQELFISFIDHYRTNTKYFYDKAYFISKEAVPGFFHNYEESILQCGKYTMLLKAYNPNHRIFDLEIPKIVVRLSFDEIEKLEKNCQKYTEKAREVCGKPVTVSDIFENRAKRRKEFQQKVYQKTREMVEKWNLEQQKLLTSAADEKRKRFEELTARLTEAKQNRIDKRRENVELELRTLREAEKLEQQRLERKNTNLHKRIEYYQELSDILKSEDVETNMISPISDQENTGHSSKNSLEQTPTTMSSQATTFRDCTYDEDRISQSTECASRAFEIEFAKTAQELRAYCAKRDKEYDNNNFMENSNEIEDASEDVNLALRKQMKRSVSDIINSNILNEESSDTGISTLDSLNAREVNRLKTLTGTIGLCFQEDSSENMGTLTVPLSDLQLNRQKILSVTEPLHMDYKLRVHRKSLPDINLNVTLERERSDLERNRDRMMHGPTIFLECDEKSSNETYLPSAPLTDLQRNRQRVLTEEYALRYQHKEEMHRKSLPDFNQNALSNEILSDLQRNRKRMMQSPHIFNEFNKPALSTRPTLNLNLDTERSRNRRKVLESEYNILTGDAVTTREILTPMSTTSDPPITEQLSENEKRSESTEENLRLSISIATRRTENEKFSDDMEDSVQPSTAATQPPTTPFEALNTAGVRARNVDGFDFNKSKAPTQSNDEGVKPDLAKVLDNVDEPLGEDNNATTYEWCKKLVESKFQCPTRSSVFNINCNRSSKTASNKQNENDWKNFKIDSLSVITLTEFLQKSIIMPMNTYLNLVNTEVMRVLLEDLQLIDHFRSLRHYFFLMDGEFGSIICDGIIRQVESGESPSKVLSYQTLHMILDSALNFSIQKDRNAENLSFVVSEIPAKFELNSPSVLNVLSLNYRVQWPLNLILNIETLEQYGNIFKFLLKVRRISWVLERAFELLRQGVKQHGKRLLHSPQYLRIQQIRHKFYHFVHTLQHHITATALQASWKLFKDEIIHAKSLEDIYRLHTQYVKRILFLCMLNRSSAEFNNTIENIFRISLKFYNNLKSCEFKERAGTKEFTHSRYHKMISEEEEFEKLIKFTIYLGNKIVRRGYQMEIGEFITLININQYYTS